MKAVEAMASVGTRHQVLDIRSGLPNLGNMLITVQDTGPGIDLKDMDRIF
jgi:signal transduction histidine kinase